MYNNFLDYEKTQEKIFEKAILDNPNNIWNYIKLSNIYEENEKTIDKVLLPIIQAEYKARNEEEIDALLIRKFDIYANFADIDLEDMNNEDALENFLKAWEIAKVYIFRKNINSIYDMHTTYCLNDLISNVSLIYNELGTDYEENKIRFVKEVMYVFNLDSKKYTSLLNSKA